MDKEVVLNEILELCQSIVNLKNELNSDDHIQLAGKIISIIHK
jgi:hypothetical protein